MGFCLFEHSEMDDLYFAVNAAHVLDVALQEKTSGTRPVCLIEFEFTPEGFEALAVGSPEDINSTLKETSKIGMKKANVHVLGGKQNNKLQPLLFNHADRAALVSEIPADEMPESDGSFVTASRVFTDDGEIRMIVERPGVFARLVNARGRVPVLTV